MNKNFDLEQAAFRIKVLHSMMEDVNADAGEETCVKAQDRLYVLLDAMEPLVNDLYEYATNGGET